jgi:hypothetical protein
VTTLSRFSAIILVMGNLAVIGAGSYKRCGLMALSDRNVVDPQRDNCTTPYHHSVMAL